MDHRYVRATRVAALGLVFVTATFHLWWGFPRALIYLGAAETFLSSGLPPDPRPFLFVAFSVLVLAGPYLVTRDVISTRRAYQFGFLAMVLSFAGWVVWHQTGHGAFLLGDSITQPVGHTHGGGVVYNVLLHFVMDPVEGAIKSIELLAAALFAFLLRTDQAAETEG